MDWKYRFTFCQKQEGCEPRGLERGSKPEFDYLMKSF